MSFQFSPELDKKVPPFKVFTKLFSEISNRYDAQFYWANINFDNCIKLSKIARVSGGKRLPKGFDYSNTITNFRYLRVGDINWDSTLNYNDFKYISEELFYILKRYMISNGELMIAIVGATIGKCSLLSNPLDDVVVLTENCAKIRLKTDKVMPEYLLLLLQSDFVQKQIQLNHIQTTLPKLGLDRVLSLQIPEPPSVELQQHYLGIYQKAFHIKRKKEKEAQRLLNSIDDYLLGELGIELPEREENSIQSRMFTRRLSEVSCGRFDPDYSQDEYKLLQNSLQQGCFESKTIREVTDSVINGNTPASTEYSDVETAYPIIKVKSYKGEYISLNKLDFTLVKKIKRARKNDIFILSAAHQASYVGRFIKFLESEPLENTSFVGELICIRPNDAICNPMYLFSLLNTEACKVLLNREKTGQTSHIYPTDIKHIKIPLPPLEKQSEIADQIIKIRNQAKQLQQQAKDELEKAKREVETMILGENDSKA